MYRATVQLDTVGAYDEERRVRVLSYHTFLVGPHSQRRLAHDRGPAMEATRSISGDEAHHMPYSSLCGTTRPTVSSSHPFLAAPETPSKTYLVSDRLPVRDLLPGDTHNYRSASYIRHKSGQRTKYFPGFQPWPCATIPSTAIAIILSVPCKR